MALNAATNPLLYFLRMPKFKGWIKKLGKGDTDAWLMSDVKKYNFDNSQLQTAHLHSVMNRSQVIRSSFRSSLNRSSSSKSKSSQSPDAIILGMDMADQGDKKVLS